MTKDEKIAYLCQEAGIRFCITCDKPIHIHNGNVPYYVTHEQDEFQCLECVQKEY